MQGWLGGAEMTHCTPSGYSTDFFKLSNIKIRTDLNRTWSVRTGFHLDRESKFFFSNSIRKLSFRHFHHYHYPKLLFLYSLFTSYANVRVATWPFWNLLSEKKWFGYLAFLRCWKNLLKGLFGLHLVSSGWPLSPKNDLPIFPFISFASVRVATWPFLKLVSRKKWFGHLVFLRC